MNREIAIILLRKTNAVFAGIMQNLPVEVFRQFKLALITT